MKQADACPWANAIIDHQRSEDITLSCHGPVQRKSMCVVHAEQSALVLASRSLLSLFVVPFQAPFRAN